MMPVPDTCDVLILGGGPAGTATALALRRRDPALRVVLVERSDYSTVRVGESLPPPAQALLRKLGVWDEFLRREPLASAGTRAAWGSPVMHDNEFIYTTFGRGWHLDRRDFDAMLAEQAELAGVTVLRQTTAYITRDADGWNARLGDETLRARFVVDATGRRSAFARAQGARHEVFDHLVGVAVFHRFDAHDRSADTCTMVEACEHGWWYAAALPNGEVAALFMTDASHLARIEWRTVDHWRSLMQQAPAIARRLAQGIPLSEPKLHAAASQRLDRCAGEGWLAVGDAACTWDPLSSQGVMKSLQSGIDASLVIERHLKGDARVLSSYEALVHRSYSRYLDGRAAYYALEQRWPESPFWKARHEVLTLHPGQRLQAAPIVNGDSRWSIPTRLSMVELQALTATCNQPRPAHEVLTAFKASHPSKRSDREVLLAMQTLVAHGLLTTS